MTDTIEQGQDAPIIYTFSNRSPNPDLDTLMAMVYRSVYENTLGIMEAKNKTTGAIEVVLVGVEVDSEGRPSLYPLASLLRAEDVPNYLSPDGKGGYYDPADPEQVEPEVHAVNPENLVDVPV